MREGKREVGSRGRKGRGEEEMGGQRRGEGG